MNRSWANNSRAQEFSLLRAMSVTSQDMISQSLRNSTVRSRYAQCRRHGFSLHPLSLLVKTQPVYSCGIRLASYRARCANFRLTATVHHGSNALRPC
jgi:hypothetical protein